MLTVLVDYDSGNLHSAAKAFQRMADERDAGEILVSSRPEDVARADRIVLPGDGAFAACRAALADRSGLSDAITEAVQVHGRPFMGICIGMQMLADRGLENGDTPGFGWIAGDVTRIRPALQIAPPPATVHEPRPESGPASGPASAPAFRSASGPATGPASGPATGPASGAASGPATGAAGSTPLPGSIATSPLKVPHMGWNDLVIDPAGARHPVLHGITSGDHAYFVHSYQFVLADPATRLAHVDYGGAVTAIIGKGTVIGTQFHPEKSQGAGLRLIANFLTWSP